MEKKSLAEKKDSGFTLIELVVAIMIFSIATMGLIAALLSSQSLDATSRRQSAVYQKLDEVIQTVKGRIREDTFTNVYNDAKWGHNKTHPVLGVNGTMVAGDPIQVVKIEYILDETITVPVLDINGDGDTTDKPVTDLTTVKVFFLRVSAKWKSNPNNAKEKEQTAEMSTIIYPNGLKD